MMNRRLYRIMLLSAAVFNGFLLQGSIFGPNRVDHTIKFDGLAKELAEVAGIVVIEGTKALGDAVSTKEFTTNLSQTIVNGMEAVNKAMDDQSVKGSINTNVRNIAKNMGSTMHTFSEELRQAVFPEIGDLYRDAVSSILNMRNVLQYGGLSALGAALVVTGTYGTKTLWTYIEKRITDPKPDIVLPGSRYGRKDRIKKWWSNYKTPEMIFPNEVEDRLIEIIEKTTNIRDNINKGITVTYDNLLLHGKPGTGKTLFARILADKTNMDFVSVTAASLLQSGVSGIKYFNELLDMAKSSKYGLIIFVDEADALFVDRDNLKVDSDHYKVLSHILALTGEGNAKFMLVAATNHAHAMDSAMSRRFQDRVDMPLPDALTREKLITLYVEKELLNTKENSAEFVEVAELLFTPEMIMALVEQTDGLSNAEIKDIITAIRKKALSTADAMLVFNHIDSSVKQGVEKHYAFENDKKNHDKKIGVTPSMQR